MLSFQEWMNLKKLETPMAVRMGIRPPQESVTEHQATKPISWHAPSFDEESGELERTSRELNIPFYDLMQAFEKGRLVPVDREQLAKLENSDWKEMRPNDFLTLKKHADGYGKKIGSQDERGTLMHAFAKNEALPAPIVLKMGERLYLIAGNTRLMTAAVFNVLPKVWLLEIDQKE